MMKYLLMLLLSTSLYADDYYVVLKNVDNSNGKITRGEVVSVKPYTEQYAPKPHTNKIFKTIVVELTKEEITDLLKPEYELIDKDGEGDYRNRKLKEKRRKKIDIDALNITKQGQKIEKTIFTNNLSLSID